MARVILNHVAIEDLLGSKEGPVGRDLLRRARRVETYAKKLAPVDTDRLRTSIGYSLNRDEKGLFVRIGSEVEYAIYQELGTRYQSGTPYLRPALKAAGERGETEF